jgi:tetratricopeptide (TPR) repeat protein
MNRADLAARLAAADADHAALLADHAALADAQLAWELKDLYYATSASDPLQATGAATALTALSQLSDDDEIRALAAWTAGLVALQVDGQMVRAIEQLDQAAAQFELLGRFDTAAATQVSKIYALAMLGRYDQAIAIGLRARDVMLAYDDQLAAGKIEQNIGNLYHRRDLYQQAEQYYVAARARFIAVANQPMLALAENGIANVLALQNMFRAAGQLYEQALARAESAGLHVTQAMVECNLGNLALFQGNYDRALDYLERSRRGYAVLEMPHESAIAELAVADAYLELNLAPEAAAVYTRVIPTFAELEMRSEQAWALAHHAHAGLLLGQLTTARAQLATARALYVAEENVVGEAMVMLTEAQTQYLTGDYQSAQVSAETAAAVFTEAGTWGPSLLARWLHGESARALGQEHAARSILESALRDAEDQLTPQIAQRCHTSLGLLAAHSGDTRAAEEAFKRAVALIEALRAPLPAEEFRTAFAADKLTPYAELARLCLIENRLVEALDYVERMRARALLDLLGGALPFHTKSAGPFEAGLLIQIEELREELNWFYSQINRPREGEFIQDATVIEQLYQEVRTRETALQEITRQLQQRGSGTLVQPNPLDLVLLQHDLGPDTVLVEYFALDNELLAFVVTDTTVEVVGGLTSEEQLDTALEQFRLQVDTLHNGAERMRPHLAQLTARAQHHLGTLYDMLLKPFEQRLGTRRLVVVPHRALHSVPFHALYDGTSYLIERREVVYAPSASVLHHCLARPQRPLRRAVLLGTPDAQTPWVRDEIQTLAALFPDAIALVEEHATLAALRTHAPSADVLHLACHGQFRPDNPLFSALRLADAWLTARDAYDLDLNCGLVTLSACETGVNAVVSGDELIGLVRGFFSAGAPSLLVSLWMVDDQTTALLMSSFYYRLRQGDRPATALRYAQRELMAQYPHPFFWSPFVLLGRW